MQTVRLKFSLQIPNREGNLTFISVPQTNSYQKISSVVYSKAVFENTEEKLYKNKVLVLKDPALQMLEFDAVLKEHKTAFKSSILKYKPTAKKLIKNDIFINGKDEQIKNLAKNILGKDILEEIKNSYDFVLSFLEHGYPFQGLYPYSQALRDRVTDSGGFSTLLASILNSKGVPTRIVAGFLLKVDKSTNLLSHLPIRALSFENLEPHIWLEAMLPNGKWFVMDPHIEWRRKKGQIKREGGFGSVYADRIVMSFGHNLVINKAKKYQIPILNYPESTREV